MSLSIQIARIKKRCRFNTNYASTDNNNVGAHVCVGDRSDYAVMAAAAARCSNGSKKMLPFELSK